VFCSGDNERSHQCVCQTYVLYIVPDVGTLSASSASTRCSFAQPFTSASSCNLHLHQPFFFNSAAENGLFFFWFR
jgi:hypothetical protein